MVGCHFRDQYWLQPGTSCSFDVPPACNKKGSYATTTTTTTRGKHIGWGDFDLDYILYMLLVLGAGACYFHHWKLTLVTRKLSLFGQDSEQCQGPDTREYHRPCVDEEGKSLMLINEHSGEESLSSITMARDNTAHIVRMARLSNEDSDDSLSNSVTVAVESITNVDNRKNCTLFSIKIQANLSLTAWQGHSRTSPSFSSHHTMFHNKDK